MPGRGFAHGCFNIVIGTIKFLPYPVYRWIVFPVIYLMHLASRRLSRHALESLTIAFGDKLSLPEKQRISRACFFNLSWGLADLAYYIAKPEAARARFDIKGQEHLDQALAGGKGAILTIAHFGPFAAMLSRFLCDGHVVKVVMRAPRSNAWREELLRTDVLAPRPVYSTPLRACVAACFEVLKRNQLLVMPIDQNYGGQGRVFVDFFGRRAATAAGPAVYAWKTGAPLLTAFARPMITGRGQRWQIVLEPVEIDRTLPEKEAVRRATQEFTARVEAQAREFPEQWSWMHRRWKAVPRENE